MLPVGERVVMVSGANRGIGRAVAERLYADGYRMSLGARDAGSLAPVLSGMAHGHSLAHAYEARSTSSAEAWVAATLARFGRIDAVVANAGVSRDVGIEAGSEADLDLMWEVNAKGPFRLIRAAFSHLKASGAGRIVTVVSLSGKRVKSADAIGYCMSKFAALALTHGARQEGWAHGIRAAALCPGWTNTDMAADAGAGDPARADMTQPETLAALVSLLLALPNTASVAELPVNCLLDASF